MRRGVRMRIAIALCSLIACSAEHDPYDYASSKDKAKVGWSRCRSTRRRRSASCARRSSTEFMTEHRSVLGNREVEAKRKALVVTG